ncbi:T9SS type A sorting domain-containing protein [Aquirufa lenticrescens]|uniref:T9SS type A sorting domain-containing protein n=1 Tax=Aquirufa lenticrescens TaxID=2696560 RepID=UPI001CAA4DBE|nr:T9SS type A sorting domain-containing protein [Aquirufa lenticrescens]UAJ15075.1 T9SS type A sorting domain-containing protein [Aquirufa lenticrescens]
MKKLLLSLTLVLTAHLVLAQKVISSAIGSGGTTTTVDGKYYSQIIGQQSAVTGTSTNGGVVVRQGFKQPSLLERSIAASGIKLNVQEENPITYTTYPNPFVDKLTIGFSVPSTKPTFVAIYDQLGSVIYQHTYEAPIKEIVFTDFSGIRVGKYVLHVISSGKPFATTIVKE